MQYRNANNPAELTEIAERKIGAKGPIMNRTYQIHWPRPQSGTLLRATPYVLLALLLALLTASPFLPNSYFGVFDTLDMSWEWAQYINASHHAVFGVTSIFTYGPLGYLDNTLLGGSRKDFLLEGLLALAVEGLFILKLADLFKRPVRAQRSSVFDPTEIMTAVFVTLAGLVLLHLTVSYLLFSLVILEAAIPHRYNSPANNSPRSIALGALLAVVSLIKVSYLLPSLLVILITILSSFSFVPSSKDVAKLTRKSLVIGFSAAYLLLWLFFGGPLTDLPTYLRMSEQIITGYSEVMGLPGIAIEQNVILVLAVIIFVQLAAGASRSWRSHSLATKRTKDHPVDTGPASYAYLAIFLLVFLKEGLVRADPTLNGGHPSLAFLGLMLVQVAIYALKPEQHLWRQVFSHLALATTVTASLVVLPSAIAKSSPGQNLSFLNSSLSDIVNAPAYSNYVSAQIAALEASYRVPSTIVRQLGHAPVLILSPNLTIGPAYGLNEVLLPVAQLYSAYTSELDTADVAAFARIKPPYVLFEYGEIDGRYQEFSAPAVYDFLLTHYRLTTNIDGFAVYKFEGSRSRVYFHGKQSVTAGRWTSVPKCSGTSEVRLSTRQSLVSKAVAMVYRTPEVFIELRTHALQGGPFRLVWPNASDGLDMTAFYTGPPAPFPQMRGSGFSAISAFRIYSSPGLGGISSHATATFYCLHPPRTNKL